MVWIFPTELLQLGITGMLFFFLVRNHVLSIVCELVLRSTDQFGWVHYAIIYYRYPFIGEFFVETKIAFQVGWLGWDQFGVKYQIWNVGLCLHIFSNAAECAFLIMGLWEASSDLVIITAWWLIYFKMDRRSYVTMLIYSIYFEHLNNLNKTYDYNITCKNECSFHSNK